MHRQWRIGTEALDAWRVWDRPEAPPPGAVARRALTFLSTVMFLVAAAGRCMAQTGQVPAPKPPLDNEGLLRKYVWSSLGPEGAFHASLNSGLDQWQRDPPEWGTGSAGYAKRWASSFGESLIGSTTKYAVARIMHQDPSFTRSGQSGVMPRLRHALISPFSARKRDGHRSFSLATMAGLAAGNIIPAATWYPEPDGIRGGAQHAAFGVLSKMGVSVVREFFTFPHLSHLPGGGSPAKPLKSLTPLQP